MKMNFRPQNRLGKRRVIKKVVFILLLIFLLFIVNMFFSNPFSKLANWVASPIWSAKQTSFNEVGNFTSLLRSKKSLYKENKALREQLIEVEYLFISNSALELENNSLKELLNRELDKDTVLATVLSRPNASPYDTLVIDTGYMDGIQIGDSVLAYGDFVIGRISNVYSNSSQVKLFSSPGEKTAVIIGTEDVPAIAEGVGAGNFSIKIPRDTTVIQDDIIVLPNINLQVFGVVEHIITSPADSFKTILFKNPVNINHLKWVEVLQSK